MRLRGRRMLYAVCNYQGQGAAEKTPGKTGHHAARERSRHTNTPSPQPSRDNTRDRIPSESRTSRGEVGSSQHERSNSSSELSSQPEPKGAGRLLEKTPHTAGGKPSGDSENPEARERETNQRPRDQKPICTEPQTTEKPRGEGKASDEPRTHT